jgi:hypothetical protein
MSWTFLYVAILYFGFIWVWRRWGSPFPWRVAGLFYLLILVGSFETLVLNYTRLPADHVLGLYPWRAYSGIERARNPETNDVILQMVPWAHQVRESWKALEVPLWNDAAGGGYPLLANGQSGALALLRLISLPLDLPSSFANEAALKILMALTFSFLYMQKRGRTELASVITAISYGFCTYITIWLHYAHSSVAAFLPAVFYAIELFLERVTFRRIFFAAIVFALLLLHGHPETAAHTMFAAGLYLLFAVVVSRAPVRQRLAPVGAVVLAGVLSILLSLPFLLPFIEALPRSQRYEHISATPPDIRPSGPKFLVPFFQPRFYGTEHERNLWGPGIAEVICGYAGVLGVVGWFGLLFALIRDRTWREPTTFYLLMTPPLIGVVLGWPGFTDIIHKLPLYSMAANSRLRVAICWFLAVLAGEVVELLLRRRVRTPMLFGLSAVTFLLLLLFVITNFPTHDRFINAVMTTMPRAAVLIAALFLTISTVRTQRYAAAALVIAVFVDLWSTTWGWYPKFPKHRVYPITPLIAELRNRAANPELNEIIPHRITGTSAAFFPNSASMFGLDDIRAHDPMAFGRVLGALRVYTGYTSDQYFGFLQNIDDPFLDYLNVRYIVTSPVENYRSERFREVYSDADGKIYQNRDALPRFYAPRNVFVEFDDVKRTQMIVEHRDWRDSVVLKRLPSQMIERIYDDLFKARPPDAPVATVRILAARTREFRLDVTAPRWTLVIGSQPNWPGWRIYRGKERLKQIEVNGAFMGFLVPPGRSDIRVIYVPRTFYVGTQIALATLAALLTLLAWQQFRRRKL